MPSNPLTAAQVLLCLALVVVGTARSASQPVAPSMPSPNAYAIYAKAGGLIVDEDEIADFVQELRHGRPIRTQSIRATVARNAQAIEMVRLGFRHQYRYPHMDDMNSERPEFSHFRTLTRLFVLD